MIRDYLAQFVSASISNLIASGKLPESVRETPVEISDTKQPEHGDFACNFAMTASKKAGMNPRQLGEILKGEIESSRPSELTAIDSVEIAGPGFLNIRLNPAWIASFVPQILEKGDTLPTIQRPTSSARPPQRINVEFVSVNPNGPITIGSGRGAAYGSTLCNVLEAVGNTIHREYYVNDGVSSEQMRLFAQSVVAIREGRPIPDNGYKGDYVAEVADQIGQYDELLDFDFSKIPVNELAPQQLDEPQAGAIRQFLRRVFKVEPTVVDDPWQDPLTRLALATLGQARSDGFSSVKFVREEDRGVVTFSREGHTIEAMTIPLALWEPLEDFFGKRVGALEVGDARWFALIPDHGFEHLVKLIRNDIGKPGFTLEILPYAKLRNAPPSDRVRVLSESLMVSRQAHDLFVFGTHFQTWFYEQSLHESGAVAEEIEKMIASGVADERPERLVLKLARGGVIEDVEVEPQTGDVEADDDTPNSQASQPSANPAVGPTLWLRSTKFDDDMDRVMRRRDGRLTYIASDVAYHKEKFNRPPNADKLITVLGPDHHGYIGRLRAVVAAMIRSEGRGTGNQGQGTREPLSEVEAKIYTSPEERDACQAALAEAKRKLEIQIYQLVRFMKDGKPAPMRKRDGNIYALIDLIKEIGEKVTPRGAEAEKLTAGKDVARFFYLMRSHDTTFDFDLNLAEKQSDENPVFYVQYAHARICSVIRKAEEAGIQGPKAKQTPTIAQRIAEATPVSGPLPSETYGLLTHSRELTLVKKICDLPFEVERCANDYGVHRLTTYAIELARTYHHFYDACRVVQPDQPDLSKARLALCEATRVALKATLDLLGISAPERMDRESAEA